jgi:type III secretion protein C
VGGALVEFGKNIGITVRGSKEVKGRLSAGMPVGTAREFLEWVCNRYGLVWHFDGSVIHVASETEMQTEMFKVDANTASSAAERLATLGVSDLRFPVKVFEKDDVVSVSGPPSYVALVKKTLGVTTGASQDKDGAVPVRVFRGRSAETRNFQAEKP